MQQKEKFTIEQQINHMEEQDIKFDLHSKEKAEKFLTSSNYYFKVKAFAKNYEKIDGKYKNLDFAYLRKFSILDTAFRDLVLELSLLCEHLVKTYICYQYSINNMDDGYVIVQKFLNASNNPALKISFPQGLKRYDEGRYSFYTKDLLDKYRQNLPLWVFVEILSFDELIQFYKFYIQEFNVSNNIDSFNLYAIKSIRNIAAHNNCILHTLTIQWIRRHFTVSQSLIDALKSKGFQTTRTNSKLKIPMIHDFLCLILTFSNICPHTGIKDIMKNKIDEFFNKCEERNEYFCHNTLITERYQFIKRWAYKLLS